MTTHSIISACTLVDVDGRVLLQTCSTDKTLMISEGKWQLPQTLVQQEESPEDALIAELDDKLNINVVQSCLAPLTFARKDYRNLHHLMAVYVCRRWEGMMFPKQGQDIRWVRAKNLRDYKLDELYDPIVAHLIDILP